MRTVPIRYTYGWLLGIQKQFLLFVLRHLHNPLDYSNLPSYEHRLKDIFLESLETRRENLSATFVFKILHDGVDSSILKESINRLTRVSYLLTYMALRPQIDLGLMNKFFP
jgi:hypothetical protein